VIALSKAAVQKLDTTKVITLPVRIRYQEKQ
jgi:rare lipoprotein A (peptidoglycan hydrolase)